MPLSGLSIGAVADRVVVREGGSRWQAESGQYLLEFDGDPADGSLSVIERTSAAAAPNGAQAWFAEAAALEQEDTEAATRGVRARDRRRSGVPRRAHQPGRLLHESGRLAQAERVYREATRGCGDDPVLLYNLGVLLDDMDRKAEAVEAYEAALRVDPGSPIVTTTWRCCTRSWRSRRTRSATWRAIAR